MKEYKLENGNSCTSLDFISNEMNGDMWDTFKKELTRVFKNYKKINVNRVAIQSSKITVYLISDTVIRRSAFDRLDDFNGRNPNYHIHTLIASESKTKIRNRYVYSIDIVRRGSIYA